MTMKRTFKNWKQHLESKGYGLYRNSDYKTSLNAAFYFILREQFGTKGYTLISKIANNEHCVLRHFSNLIELEKWLNDDLDSWKQVILPKDGIVNESNYLPE